METDRVVEQMEMSLLLILLAFIAFIFIMVAATGQQTEECQFATCNLPRHVSSYDR